MKPKNFWLALFTELPKAQRQGKEPKEKYARQMIFFEDLDYKRAANSHAIIWPKIPSEMSKIVGFGVMTKRTGGECVHLQRVTQDAKGSEVYPPGFPKGTIVVAK